jgi:phospholipid/cholesterol/gamma-HCH transport system substrate-binding protein
MGDYTNLSVQLDLDLTGENQQSPPDPNDLCSNVPSNPICDQSGPVTETLSNAEKCILSGDPNSDACKKVSLNEVKDTCAQDKYKDTGFCKVVLAVPDSPADEPLPPLPSLPGLPLSSPGGGLLRPAFGAAGSGDRTTDYDDELAPLLVWGMVQR